MGVRNVYNYIVFGKKASSIVRLVQIGNAWTIPDQSWIKNIFEAWNSSSTINTKYLNYFRDFIQHNKELKNKTCAWILFDYSPFYIFLTIGIILYFWFQNKRRYQEDGVDLDLTYVTSRIIAMSFPSSGCMAWYRNPICDVALFLDKKHGDQYRVRKKIIVCWFKLI